MYLVVDGMGGGLGAQIVSQLRQELPSALIIAVGTNSAATTAMVKAGANRGATGENSVRVCVKSAKFIFGPMGIIIPDAMLGEITPEVAHLIASSEAQKILIPVGHHNLDLVGLENLPVQVLIKKAVEKLKN